MKITYTTNHLTHPTHPIGPQTDTVQNANEDRRHQRTHNADQQCVFTKQSEARTTSEVEETPERQMLLWEDTPVEDPAPIARNTEKGKGKYIPLNSEDNHDALLSPQ